MSQSAKKLSNILFFVTLIEQKTLPHNPIIGNVGDIFQAKLPHKFVFV